MNEQDVLQFVDAAKYEVTEHNQLARCVDGRYQNLENFPAIAKPGGDAGDVLAAFAALNRLNLDIDPGRVIDLVVSVAGGNKNFSFHTDQHAEHDSGVPGMGCGHLKQAQLDPDSYLVKPSQIDFIFNQLPHLLEQGARQEVLQGDHQEQAVVVVDSQNFSIKPLLGSGSEEIQEVFVYQKTLHEQQLSKLAQLLQETILETGQVVEQQDVLVALHESFQQQLGQTLQRLAKDLPVYQVSINELGEVSLLN